MAVDPLLQRLVVGFAKESREICQRITRDLLALEQISEDKASAKQSYASLCRQLHTLKGSAATLGLDDISELAHQMENAVIPLQGALVPIPAILADAILKGLDTLLNRVNLHAEGKGEDLPWITEAVELIKHARLQPVPSGGAPDEAPPQKAEQRSAEREGAAPVAAAAAGLARAASAETAQAASQQDEGSWRVDTTQVNSLVAEVERLRELRLRLIERQRRLDETAALLSKYKEAVPADLLTALQGDSKLLGGDSEEAADIVSSLEEGLKAICTLPTRTILDPLQRTVRDLCRQFGKQAKFSVVGAELALDRRQIEALKGPLIHLVRNSIDHGLEKPEERKAAGKHHEGALVIRVEQVGNVLFLEVADDGRGIDVETVKEVARARGFASEEDLSRMTEVEIQQFIFRPGFSTKREVSEISGRGVGLDVVLNQVRQLDGHVEVHSVWRQGTRFILNLPARLGSSPVLLVRGGDTTVGLPLMGVETIRPASPEQLHVGRMRMQIEHRDELLPLLDLGGVLRVRQPTAPAEGQPIVIIQVQGRRLALAVDDVLGHHELLIRPLPRELRNLPAYQGAATLAGGDLLLVLRPTWLVENAITEPTHTHVRRALVVDDSLTARALHRAMLEAGGFQVHTASSGRQGLEHLGRTSYDVVICDIGMEEMDGLDFTRRVRSRAETRGLPIILVSALDSEAGRSQGMEVGADGFLSKKDCASGRLLSEVSAVISRRRGAA